MQNKLEKLAEAATLLDSMGEVKLADQIDALVERLALEKLAAEDPDKVVRVLKKLRPQDISSALMGNATMTDGIDLLSEFKSRGLWNGEKPLMADIPTVARDIFTNIALLPNPAPAPQSQQAAKPTTQQDTTAPKADNKEHNKTDKRPAGKHQGMVEVQSLMNEWLKKNKPEAELLEPNGNQGDQATWNAIKQNLLLIPGRDFKNYQQLATKIKEFIARPVAQPKEPWKVPPRRDVPPAQDRGAEVTPGGSLQLKNNPPNSANPQATVNATTFEGDRANYKNVDFAPKAQYAVHSEKAGEGWVTTYYKVPDGSGSLRNPTKVRHTARG